MGIEVREVKNKRDLKRFVMFPFELYRNSRYWIPPMIKDEKATFDPISNPAYEHCQSKLWLAFDGDKVVGRIAGIIHSQEAKEEQLGRFGWIDFIDDHAVSKQLISTVEEWIKSQNLAGIHGPLGFTDMDFEGTLVEGFNEMGTIATIYNYEYYPSHFEQLGYKKAVDWIEMEGLVPDEVPYRLMRKADLIKARFGFKSLKFKKTKDLLPYGKGIFNVLNETYKNLHGFYPLTEKQIRRYISQYLSFLKPEFASVILSKEDEVVGFGISMPSFSRAFQKAGGRLFPFGFIYLLRALKKNDTADLYLMGALPKYQKFGIPVLILRDIWTEYLKVGIKKVVSNPMIEDNYHILTQWNEYQNTTRVRRKRRCYVKKIS